MGSTYGLAAFFDRGAVRANGEIGTFVRPSESGFDVVFHFCPLADRPSIGSRAEFPIWLPSP
jgi:hypothetical protein